MESVELLREFLRNENAHVLDSAMEHLINEVKNRSDEGYADVKLDGRWVDSSVGMYLVDREDWLAKELRNRGFCVEKRRKFNGNEFEQCGWYLLF